MLLTAALVIALAGPCSDMFNLVPCGIASVSCRKGAMGFPRSNSVNLPGRNRFAWATLENLTGHGWGKAYGQERF
jgi:hypothetical protein